MSPDGLALADGEIGWAGLARVPAYREVLDRGRRRWGRSTSARWPPAWTRSGTRAGPAVGPERPAERLGAGADPATLDLVPVLDVPALELLAGRPLVALTGAGLSTDSGIPDYRGPGSPRRTPMTFQEFLTGEPAQRRYWARSCVGWARMAHAAPNAGHRAIAELERAGVLRGLITQNVDGLHSAAGSRELIDLHGRIDTVACLRCERRSPRAELQERFTALNPGFVEAALGAAAPDGDAELEDTDGFRLAACAGCGGVLKPDVVFFGENVPRDRVARAYAMVDALAAPTGRVGGALLVAGSSLTVMSGLRFVRHAHRLDVPVVIVNRGTTRGDALATVRVDAGCSEFLPALAAAADPVSAAPG
ncbi:NAD-dependent protein deacetylase [Pseudonocardia sp.]|uniref:NAD-dependent protein deacetylase n=1 Tax=Pseudonocardia sp. TaxID=60912 RepID=UPI00262A902F|nr:NAD-dependent protein deacetylase [Pseudonocardia sp.]